MTNLRYFSPSGRPIKLVACLVIVLLLVAAYYLQFVEKLEPCPLCIFQRIAFFAMALLYAIYGLHNPQNFLNRLYALLVTCASLIGTAIAARHVWIQHLPKALVPPCSASLNILLESFPVWEVIKIALESAGDCADGSWTLFKISLAEWSLIWFCIFDALGIFLLRYGVMSHKTLPKRKLNRSNN